MLKRIHLEHLGGIQRLVLNAPRLQKVKFVDCSLRLDFDHGGSVERLLTNYMYGVTVKQLRNLKYLYSGKSLEIIHQSNVSPQSGTAEGDSSEQSPAGQGAFRTKAAI